MWPASPHAQPHQAPLPLSVKLPTDAASVSPLLRCLACQVTTSGDERMPGYVATMSFYSLEQFKTISSLQSRTVAERLNELLARATLARQGGPAGGDDEEARLRELYERQRGQKWNSPHRAADVEAQMLQKRMESLNAASAAAGRKGSGGTIDRSNTLTRIAKSGGKKPKAASVSSGSGGRHAPLAHVPSLVSRASARASTYASARAPPPRAPPLRSPPHVPPPRVPPGALGDR